MSSNCSGHEVTPWVCFGVYVAVLPKPARAKSSVKTWSVRTRSHRRRLTALVEGKGGDSLVGKGRKDVIVPLDMLDEAAGALLSVSQVERWPMPG